MRTSFQSADMGGRWRPTRDIVLVVRLQRRWNAGFYELADQYSLLRDDDIPASRYRAWIHRSKGRIDGFALVSRAQDKVVIQELWCESTGRADWNVKHTDLEDIRRLDEAWELVRWIQARAGVPTYVRIPSDNAFGRLLAIRFRLPLETSFLLSTRSPGRLEIPRPGGGYGVRPYAKGDEAAFTMIHNRCFGASLTVDEMRDWANGPRHESFAATAKDGRVVGLLIAEVRRGGKIGDFNIAIEEGHRGKGLGTMLLAQGMRYFLNKRVETVVADYWATNAPAVIFYAKHGFRLARAYDFFRT